MDYGLLYREYTIEEATGLLSRKIGRKLCITGVSIFRRTDTCNQNIKLLTMMLMNVPVFWYTYRLEFRTNLMPFIFL
jgi:hypothetical protein